MYGNTINADGDKPTCACCSSGRLKWSATLLSFFAIVLFCVSVWVPGIVQNALNKGIDDELVLTPDSEASNSLGWRMFAVPTDGDSVPIYYTAYMYNITNPHDILSGSLANVQEFGPYVFREFKDRYNTKWDMNADGKQQLTYLEWQYYTFVPERSCATCTLDDVFLSLNMPAVVLSNTEALMGAIPGVINTAYILSTDYERLFVQKSVQELLFGYKDFQFSSIFSFVNAVLHQDNPTVFPGLVGNFTYRENNTRYATPDTIYTGAQPDGGLMRQFNQYNGQSYQRYKGQEPKLAWGNEEASRIRGTDGSQFSRNPIKGGRLPCYVSELGRAIMIENLNEETETYEGIELYKYVLSPSMLINSTQNQQDYFVATTGMLNCTSIGGGVPLYLSKPHFLDVDPDFANRVSGLSPPDRDAHDTFINVEPITGATMRAAKRLQVAMALTPRNFTYYCEAHPVWLCDDKLIGMWWPHLHKDLIVPLAWFEEAAAIPSDKASDFKSQVYTARAIIYYTFIVPVIVAIVFSVIVMIMFFIAIRRHVPEQKVEAQYVPYHA